jgi:tryptophanyl-tRNA synthetase
MQNEYFCYFCVVDLHALTQAYEPKEMRARVSDMVIDLMSLGIDPDRSVLFVQSQVPEHTELAWVLNTVSQFGDLARMTQFKDKSQRQADNINAGLFTYPVLQAADILLYKAQLVPIGQDQVQHIELARRIARAFNSRWGKVFPEPEPQLSSTPKILGLDGKAKMSKSMGNTISLRATDKQIRGSLAKAATDPARVMRDDPGDPDKCNVYSIHNFFSTDEQLAWVREGCTTAGIGCSDCKKVLSDNIIEHLVPIRRRREELVAPEQVSAALAKGRDKARETAGRTMAEVRKKLGLWS